MVAIKAPLRDEVMRALWRDYPQHCVVLTDPGLRRAVDAGIARAARHGFARAAEVGEYVGLMIFLGGSFDDDPQLPWAAAWLRASRQLPRPEAITGLLEEAVLQMERVVGRRGAHYRRALRWASERSFAELTAGNDASDDALRALLHAMHRRKCEALDDATLLQLFDEARNRAGAAGRSTPSGVIVYAALMFLLGIGFDRDPFHPWASDAIARVDAVDDRTGALLHAAAVATLQRYTRIDLAMRKPPVED